MVTAESCVAASASLVACVVCAVCVASTVFAGSTLSSDIDRWSVAALEVDIVRSEVGDDATFAGEGSANTAASVLDCRLFMRVFCAIAANLQSKFDIITLARGTARVRAAFRAS